MIQAIVHATATPLVTPAVQAVASHTNTLADTLNGWAGNVSQTDLLFAAGALATGIQYLANRFASFKKFTNQLLGLLIPFLVAAPATINGLKNLGYGSIIYCVAQVLYYCVEKLKDSVANSLVPPVSNPEATPEA